MSNLSDYVAQAAGIPEAPIDGITYGRRGFDASWQTVYTQVEADAQFAPMVHVHPYVDLVDPQNVGGEKTFTEKSAFDGAAINPAYGLNVGGSINVGAGQNFYIGGSPIETFVDAPSDDYTYGRQNGGWVQISAGGGGTITNLSTSYYSTYATIVNSGGQDTNINAATEAVAGLLTAADKVALNAALTVVNLANTRTSTSVTITNSGGNNTTLSAATTSLAGVMTATDKSKLDGVPSDFPDIDPGTALGQTLYWTGSKWDNSAVINRPASNRVELNFGNASSTWPTACGTNFRAEGAIQADADMACVDIFCTGNVVANGNVGADVSVTVGDLSGSGEVMVEANNSGRLQKGSPVAAMARLDHLKVLVMALETEGVITPAVAATLNTAFTP